MFCSVFILFYFFHSVQQNLWCVSCTNTKKTKHPELNKVVIECVIWLEFTVASAFVGRLLRTHSSQTTMWSAVHSFTAIRFRAYIHFHFQFYVYLSAISTSRNLTPTLFRRARNKRTRMNGFSFALSWCIWPSCLPVTVSLCVYTCVFTLYLDRRSHECAPLTPSTDP